MKKRIENMGGHESDELSCLFMIIKQYKPVLTSQEVNQY